ncbi:MAG: UDP-N-acetylmuramate--L-alanine ligase [Actinobacteria bacterium]|nr:UDP-N-acetylmuramate--L-alanine ligase [Actinomycetota bacterium]
MSGIAHILLQMGCSVSGSDIKESRNTMRLASEGAVISIGHSPENINSAEIVVYSSAISPSNCELVAAKKRNIFIISRGEMLAKLASGKKSIAIGGTHGKTTTTSMVSLVFEYNKMDPTFLIGGELNDIGSNAKFGKSEYFIAEVDESDGSLLHMNSETAVITNIELDHLDYYKDYDNIENVFLEFANKVSLGGQVIVCGDFDNLRKIKERIKSTGREVKTYGLNIDNDIYASDIKLGSFGSMFNVYINNSLQGLIKLKVYGIHNAYNALAAVLVGMSYGIPFEKIASVLEQFTGVKRRFQYKGAVDSIDFIDDYAHHPTEVKMTLKGARTGSWKRIVAIFQPHRYSRTKYLYDDFGDAFNDSDLAIITDIYPAGENPIPGISGKLIVDSILKRNPRKQVVYLPKKNLIKDLLTGILKENDLVLTMGAGDISIVGDEVLSYLKDASY